MVCLIAKENICLPQTSKIKETRDEMYKSVFFPNRTFPPLFTYLLAFHSLGDIAPHSSCALKKISLVWGIHKLINCGYMKQT